MSYIGNPIVSTDFPVDYASGNGSTTAFTLSVAPASVNSIDVQISGVSQSPQTYTVSGTTLTFSAAPPTGTNNIVVRHLGIAGVPNTPSAASVVTTSIAANAVTPAKMANGGAEFGMRNRIINGAMQIDQRNAGASVTINSDVFTLDRWRTYQSQTGKFSVQQNAGSVAPPAGFSNYLGITSLSSYSVGSGDYFLLEQPVEGFNFADLNFGTANAKTFTFSFWVRSSLTGTFGGGFTNEAYNRTYPFTYTISSANTWEQKSVTIAGDTTGTWTGATNATGIRLRFIIGGGSSRLSSTVNQWVSGGFDGPTGASSVVGTNGATFYLTGVQLEVGSTATNFDYRPYGTELALCQRYFEKTYDQSVAVGANSNANRIIQRGVAQSGGVAGSSISYKVEKRAAPTITFYTSTGTINTWDYNRSGASSSTSMSAAEVATSGFRFDANVGSAWAPCEVIGHWIASAEL